MDIQSYIKSGRVEHYVLGLSSPDDAREIERFAEMYPEFQAEIQAVEESLAKLSEAQAIQPPPALRAKVMEEIDRLVSGQPDKPKAKPVAQAPKPEVKPTATIDPFQPKLRTSFPWGWLVAGLLACVAGWFLKTSFDLQSRVEAGEIAAAEARARLELVEKDCAARQQKADDRQKQFVFLQLPGTKSMTMKGVEKSPTSLAVIHFNNEKRTAFLDVKSLPTPPNGKQYQLWAIKGEEKISLGVFDLPKEATDLHSILFVDSPDAFAVTLENQGGSQVPTLEEMFVVGAIEKPHFRRRSSE